MVDIRKGIGERKLPLTGDLFCMENIIKDNPNTAIRNGHVVIKLKCPNCDHEGETTYGAKEFKVLGKDDLGHIYFECPNCKSHLQFHPLTGKVKLKRKKSKAKEQAYAHASLIGAISFLMGLHATFIGWVILALSFIYTIISIKLSIIKKNESTKTKAFLVLILIIVSAVFYINKYYSLIK